MQLTQALTLEVFKQESSLKLGLFTQNDPPATLRHYNQVSVSFEEVNCLCRELICILNRPARIDAEAENARKIGRLLWDHLISRPIKEKLKDSLPAQLTLSLDEELIHIPWELIFDGSDFLSLKFSMGRLVRSRGDSTSVRYRNVSDRLKMLILANPTGDLSSAYSEGLNIKNQFAHKREKVHVDFKSTTIDKAYVKKNICDYDILHFAGHCEFDKNDSRRSGWLFSDGVFSVEEILKMGLSSDLPALIFSNACHSAELSPGPVNSGYQEVNFNMAGAFLLAGVRHYIGSIRKIEDTASQEFGRKFYTQLLSGISVGESLRLAKLKLIKDHGLAGLHWASHLLYGDPGFVFFRAKAKKQNKRLLSARAKKAVFSGGISIIIIVLGFLAAFWIPKLHPGKVYLFLNSQAQYRKGNNQAAINLGLQAINKDRNFLSVYPLIANAYWRMGEKQKALKYYFDYVLRSEKMKNRKHLADAYIKLGWFYQSSGQYAKARQFYDKAIDLSRKLKNRVKEASALRKLAVWHIDNEDYETALELLTKSIAINLAGGNDFEHRRNLASDYFDIGLVFANKDDYAGAKEFYEKSRKIFEQLKLENELSDCFFNLGEICLFQKEYQRAMDYYSKGLKIDLAQNNKVNLASDYNMIGELYLEMDNLEQAESHLKHSSELAEEINSPPDLAVANYNLGLLYKKIGKKNPAREHWRRAQEIYRSLDPEKYKEIRSQLMELDVS
ncbi:MAG: CHAT domain-containing protein [Candidatus Omnitrophica bacterium]|nr:CHAT domain-containing protein [Candidatus Omnitrophota bacterium]